MENFPSGVASLIVETKSHQQFLLACLTVLLIIAHALSRFTLLRIVDLADMLSKLDFSIFESDDNPDSKK